MKKLILVAGLLACSFQAVAQPVPQVGVTWGYIPKVTYSAGWIALVPAASTTDIVCLSGSASKVVNLQYLYIHGTAGTTLAVPASLVRRASVDTGGTAGTTTANPANTITKMDTNFPTATAVPISYTANPTITDSAGTILDSRTMAVSLTTMATVGYPAVFDYRQQVNLLSPLALRGVAQQLCVNLNATSIATGVLTGSMLWTEE